MRLKSPALSVISLFCGLWLGGWVGAQQPDRPNVMLILLDDAGWTDVGRYGSRIQTPNIDRLAAEGMRFGDCHSAAPNCSPSRAGLLTGRTPSRVGIYSYLPPGHVMHLRDSEVTIAELLNRAGYHTGHFGKWHLSRLMTDQPQPADQGFDYSLGTDNNASPSHLNPDNFVRNGQSVGAMKGYSCQIVVDETVAWLDQINAGKNEAPFFACVWFHEPHTPIASPPKLVEKYQRLYPELTKKQATYHANVENADSAIGRLLGHLDRLELSDQTLVFFTSDNGPLNAFSSVGLRGKKSHVWEGGHRVPGIYRWPGKIAAGSESNVAISGVDFLPTVCQAAGVAAPVDRTIDGVSLLPLLTGQTNEVVRDHPLYWFFYRLTPSLAVRDGRWVVIADTADALRPKAHQLLREDMPKIRESMPESFELYDLESDLAQSDDVADEYPEVLQRIGAAATRMHRDVVQEGYAWEIPESYGDGKNRKVWESR